MYTYPFDDTFFDVIDTVEKAYWLGFLTADGGMNDRTNQICINLAGRDINHLHLFQSALGRNGPIYETTSGKGHSVARLSIGSKRLFQALLNCGVFPRKSHECQPWRGPDNLMPHYWRGVFDGDGSISKTTRLSASGTPYVVWRASLNGNKSMTEGFQQFVIANGGKPGSLKPHFSIFKAAWGGNQSIKDVLAPLYNTAGPALIRKQHLAHALLGTPSDIKQP